MSYVSHEGGPVYYSKIQETNEESGQTTGGIFDAFSGAEMLASPVT